MSPESDRTVDYSIVIPVYFNEQSVSKTLIAIKEQVVSAQAERIGEVIFVDDGSGDGSFDELMRLREANPGFVRVIKLSRNFGQVNALFAGYAKARGSCVVTLSADGQDPVDLVNRMLTTFFDGEAEIVICTREGRDESLVRVLTSRVFYALMKRLSFKNMPPGGFDFFLLGRRALAVLLRNREAHAFIQGQILWMGFQVRFISYHRKQREFGVSKWTFGKKLTYLIDGVMSYSFIPIRLMSTLGALVALSGFAYAIVILCIKIFWEIPVEGWAPLMIVVLVLSGAQLLVLGVIGEYVWRTLAQARDRDPYVIEALYD